MSCEVADEPPLQPRDPAAGAGLSSSPALVVSPSPKPTSSSSSSSPFCSFDVRIWEELHLQSLLSSASSNAEEPIKTGAEQPACKGEGTKEPKPQQGFSFFSSSSSARGGASFSGFSSPFRLSNASNQSGQPLIPASTKRDHSSLLANAPLHCNAERPPVVQVIQTGSMSFTGDEVVVQRAAVNSIDRSLPAEEEAMSVYEESARKEQTIVLGTVPNAKFLAISASDVYSAPISPLKSAGSIPFKWEETPGRPKLCIDNTQSHPIVPSLQLPPKLQLHSSLSPSYCSSAHSGLNNPKHSASSSSSSFSGDGILSKSASVKNLWHSFVQSGRRSYREGRGRSRLNNLFGSDEDPCSPTSILIGPDAGLSSSSSTSSTLDAVCASPNQRPEMQSAQSRIGPLNVDDRRLSSQSRALMSACPSTPSPCDASAYVGHDLPNLAPSMERKVEKTFQRKATNRLKGFLKACQRWKSLTAHRKRNHEEAEIWEPTLATYLHSMELESSRSSSMSGQSLLHQQTSLEKCSNESNLALVAATETVPSSSSAATAAAAAADVGTYEAACMKGSFEGGVMVFSGKPNTCEKLSVGLKGRNVKMRRKGGGWVLRKVKSRLKVLAALLRVVSNNTTSTGAPNKKYKRRRRLLPYQEISW